MSFTATMASRGATLIPTRQQAMHAMSGIWRLVGERNLGLIAAGVGFFAMLAIFPAVAALIAVWGFMADPVVIDVQMGDLRRFLPPDAYELLNGQVDALILANESTLGWTTLISTVAALWSARAGVAALIEGVNAVHGTPNRGGFWHMLFSLVLTVALVGVVIVALIAVIVLPVVLTFVPLGGLAGVALWIVKWGLALGLVSIGIGIVYRYGLNRTGPRPDLFSPGLVMAVILWALVSIGFSQYLTNFGSYNRIYGSIGAVIALLMWFYLSAYVVMLGAALNAVLEQKPPVQ